MYLIPQPVLFASTFDSGTLEGWSTLKTGTISLVTDAVDGKADMYATLTESIETNNVLFGTKLFAVTAP